MGDYKYRVFISYKHSSSGTTALALEKALRRYAKPLFRPPMRVFRDEEQIAAGQDLKKTVKSALNNSEYLIYIATREAAESPYVKEELDIWCRQLKRQSRLIIIWQKDHLADDPEANSLLWEQSNAIPLSLKDHIVGIPIWIDLTWAETDEDLDLSDPRFKTLVNSVIARFRGIPPEELIGEEIKIYHRNIRIRRWGVITLALLFITAAGAAAIAWRQQNIAVFQRDKARSTTMMSQSGNILEQDKTIALQFANEAYSFQQGGSPLLITDSLLKAYYHDGFQDSKKYIKKLQHGEGVTVARFSHTGEFILTGSINGKIRLWSLDGTLLNSFTAQRFSILSADLSPDDTHIVTTGYMDTKDVSVVKLWDINGQLIDTLEGPPSEYTFAEFAHNSNNVVASFGTPGHRTSVKFWQPGKKSFELVSKESKGAKAAALSEDGQQIYVVTAEGLLELWSQTGEKQTSFRLEAKNKIVTFSKGGESVITAFGNTVNRFDLLRQQRVAQFKTGDSSVTSAILSADSKYFLTEFREGAPALWTSDGKMLTRFKSQGNKIQFIDFIGPGDQVFMASDLSLGSLWDLNGRLLNTFSGHAKKITAARTSPDGKLLMTASIDGTVKLWPLKNDVASQCAAERPETVYVDISPADASLLLAVDTDQRAHLWNLTGTLPASSLELEHGVRSAFFSPDGERIATVHEGENGIKLWDKNGKYLKQCCKHSEPIISAKFSPDGTWLSTRSQDEGVKLWTEDGKPEQMLSDERAPIPWLKFSPDGKRILVQANHKILLFDENKKLSPVDVDIGHSYNTIRFSPDSRSLLIANGKELSVFDIEQQKNATRIKDNKNYIMHLYWLPDGTGFFASDTSGRATVWDSNGKIRYQWSSMGESGSFSPIVSPDGTNVINIKTGALFNLQGEQLSSISPDRFVEYLPDDSYMLTVSRNYESDNLHTLYLADHHGKTVVSLGDIKGDIADVKISKNGSLIAILTSDNDLLLRCTAAGLHYYLNRSNLYNPDPFDRTKYGIDW